MSINYLGRNENITSIDYCITRLKMEIKDASLIDGTSFRKLSLSKTIEVGKYGVQVTFGIKAQFIVGDIKNLLKN